MKGLILGILLFAMATAGKDKDAKPVYAVNCDDLRSFSCNEYLRLELAQQKVLEAYRSYQSALSDLNAEAEKVKQENGWPEDVQFRGDTLTFSAPPDPPEKKP